jgi:hypothetical protein
MIVLLLWIFNLTSIYKNWRASHELHKLIWFWWSRRPATKKLLYDSRIKQLKTLFQFQASTCTRWMPTVLIGFIFYFNLIDSYYKVKHIFFLCYEFCCQIITWIHTYCSSLCSLEVDFLNYQLLAKAYESDKKMLNCDRTFAAVYVNRRRYFI